MSGESNRTGLGGTEIARREIWILAGIAAINHLIFDPLLTLYRVQSYGGFELNPFFRGLVQDVSPLMILMHLGVIPIFALLILAMFKCVELSEGETSKKIAIWFRRGMSGVVAWGFLITGHHLWFLSFRWFYT